MEAGDKFTREAIDVLRPEPVPAPESNRFALRGKKLYAILGGIFVFAILAVFGKERAHSFDIKMSFCVSFVQVIALNKIHVIFFLFI